MCVIHMGVCGEWSSNCCTSGPQLPTLSFRRILVWTHEPARRLEAIAFIAARCQDAKGGALLSCLHSLRAHGDPLIMDLAADLLKKVRNAQHVGMCREGLKELGK